MKKLLVFSLAVVLIISALLLLAGCKKECDHSYEKTVTSPTCIDAGEEKFTCTKCDYCYTIEIEATGHTGGLPVEENRVASCVAEGKYDSVVYCTVCDAEVSRETVTVGVAGVHNVQNGVCTACGGKESTPGLEYIQNADGTYTVTGIGTCTETDIVIGIYNNRDVTAIGWKAFYECTSLTSVVIPEGVTSIGNSAFYRCLSLTSVELPNSLTEIGDFAFNRCVSLKNITVADDNKNYKSVDGNLYSKDGKTLIQYAMGKADTTFAVPEGVTTIGGYAFRYCNSLTSIVIPEGVTTIGDYAFYFCTSLTSIELPDSLTTICDYAFADCTSLTSIVIPEGVTTIGEWAFSQCTSLTIYCKVAEKPSGWSNSWYSGRPVVWGYKGE